MDNRECNDTHDLILEANETELAMVLDCALHRLGELGRRAAEALLTRLGDGGEMTPQIEEGLAQIEAVEGVLSGRTDSL